MTVKIRPRAKPTIRRSSRSGLISTSVHSDYDSGDEEGGGGEADNDDDLEEKRERCPADVGRYPSNAATVGTFHVWSPFGANTR